MARAVGKASRTLRMAPVGERGPVFRPEQDYFSVSLVAVHLPGKLLNTSRFAPVIWSSVKHVGPDGERMLMGLFPSADAGRPEFSRNDRIEVMDLQLTPRIISREEITVEFTLGAVKEKDYLAGALDAVNELASSPAASFLSQVAPLAVGVAQGAVQTAQRLNQALDRLADGDKLQTLGRFVGTLRAPLASGMVVFAELRDDGRDLKLSSSNQLTSSAGPVKTPYVVLRIQCEAFRPDWAILPDLNQAWSRIREAALTGGDIGGAIEFFRITAVTSPDLTREDANRIVEAARQKFAPVLAGAESAEVGDPGGMAESLAFFLPKPASAAESLTLGAGQLVRGAVSAAAAAAASGPFRRALQIILHHEGGYVDHPNDPGGATNKGVTQKTYDAYRIKCGLPTQSVRDIGAEELEEIYFHGYWRPAMCQEMPNEALALLMFDAAVNHGPRQAIKLLQQAAGVGDAGCDGKWGPVTRAKVFTAAANAGGLVEACLLWRERFYRRLVDLNPKLGVFLRGWMNRIVSLRGQLGPLLARAPAVGDTESAMFEDDSTRAPLAAAPPDFSEWTPSTPAASDAALAPAT